MTRERDTRVLITGAAGFGSSGLTRALLTRGYSVLDLDVVPPSHAGLLRRELSNSGFHYLWKSIQDIQAKNVEAIRFGMGVAGSRTGLDYDVLLELTVRVMLCQCDGGPVPDGRVAGDLGSRSVRRMRGCLNPPASHVARTGNRERS